MFARLIAHQQGTKRRHSQSRLTDWLNSEPSTPALSPTSSPLMSPVLLGNELASPLSSSEAEPDETFSLSHSTSSKSLESKPKTSPVVSPKRPLSPRPSASRFTATQPTLKRNMSTRSVSSALSSRSEAYEVRQAHDPISSLFGPLHLAASFSIYHPDPLPRLSRSASASGEPSLCEVDAEARGCFGGAPIFRPAYKRRFTLEESTSSWAELEVRLREHAARSEFVHVDAT
jgi:hypothetical protein